MINAYPSHLSLIITCPLLPRLSSQSLHRARRQIVCLQQRFLNMASIIQRLNRMSISETTSATSSIHLIWHWELLLRKCPSYMKVLTMNVSAMKFPKPDVVYCCKDTAGVSPHLISAIHGSRRWMFACQRTKPVPVLRLPAEPHMSLLHH